MDNSNQAPWMRYFQEALNELTGGRGKEEIDFWSRPSQETDKLYMSVGESELIEVGHPTPSRQDEVDPR